MEYRNDRLAKMARSRGLDEYLVCEVAAILEFDYGYERIMASTMALDSFMKKENNDGV